MPDLDQDQNQDYQLTGDDLSELHGLAWQMQSAGDPRASRIWDLIAAQSGGSDGSGPAFTASPLSTKVTSWLEDLENALWGDQADSRTQSQGSDEEGGSQAVPESNDGVDNSDVDSEPETFGTGLANTGAVQQAPVQPERGEGSKSNLAKRADIAKRAVGYNGSTHWAFDTARPDVGFGEKTNKCNVYVYDMLKESEAGARVASRKQWPMPTAEEWSNPKFKIPNWRVLRPGETPQAGDVAAFPMPGHAPGEAPYTGHSGIIVTDADGTLGSMAAHDDKVGPISYNQFLHEPDERQKTVVYRRYTGD